MKRTPAPEPDPAALDSQWLVHCSPERTLVARRQGKDTLLVKIFEQGSILDAQQETELALTLARVGVVTYRAAGQDPVTNKPCVTMEYCEGENLERLIAESGPLPAARAAPLMAQLAVVLADFHDAPRPGAPHGVVHRDVKPANILLTRDADLAPQIVLMDLEHVVARRSSREVQSSAGFTGGTHGYSPPESYIGSYPHPSFDVFGLGATLFFLLTGCPAFTQHDPEWTIDRVRRGAPRLDLLVGQPEALRSLVTACLESDDSARPTMSEVHRLLVTFSDRITAADLIQDRALRAIHAADFPASNASRTQSFADPDHDRTRQATLQRLAGKRAQLLSRLGGAPEIRAPEIDEDSNLHDAAREVAANLQRLTAFLVRFPSHEDALATRQQTVRAGHALLERVLPRVAELKLTAGFSAARDLLDAAAATVQAIARIPGGLSLPTADPGHLPGPLLRNPGRLLDRARRDVENMEKVHQGLTARLEAAEAQLDLAQAGVVVDEIIAIYGGASSVVAPLKDRMLRLDFYLQRIAWPKRMLGQLRNLLELSEMSHQIDRVVAFGEFCGERAISDASTVRGKGGVRSLLETMHQLTEDFPHAQPAIAEAEEALADAMRSITEQAWKHLTEAKEKLDAVPIPIRPVQKLLNRLDGIRMLEAFLDMPERSRERLQDDIERVRMRLDQARTTRDNLARGAEEAMERGHLTTALFDMARAVDSYEDEHEADDEESGPQLSERLEEAKRRKQELERAVVENHRLAVLYIELLEEESSTMANRLGVLEERVVVLDLLIRTLGPERGAHYATDLRDVMLHLVQEKADQGERQLDRAIDPEVRLQIAQDTLHGLRETLSRSAVSNEVGGRIRRILDHWQFKEREVHDLLLREAQAAVESRSGRRRIILTWSVGAAVLVLSIFGTMQIAQGGSSQAPVLQFLAPTSRVAKDGDKITYRGASLALSTLAVFVDRLQRAGLSDHDIVSDLQLPIIASHLVDQLTNLTNDRPPDHVTLERLKIDLTDYNRSLDVLKSRIGGKPSWRLFFNTVSEFGRSAHLVGLGLIVLHRTDPTYLEVLCSDLAPLEHLAIPARDLAHLRKIASGK